MFKTIPETCICYVTRLSTLKTSVIHTGALFALSSLNQFVALLAVERTYECLYHMVAEASQQEIPFTLCVPNK